MCRWGSEQRILQLLHAIARSRDVIAGRGLHSVMLLHGLLPNAVFCDHLIRLYACSGSLLEANIVFAQSPSPSIYTWYGIILAHANNLQQGQALSLYDAMMLECNIIPNNFVLSCILKACCTIGALFYGMLIHHQAISCGIELDVIIGSAMIDMYAKCRLFTEARVVFDGLPDRNIVSYGAIIAGYAQHGCGYPALELFEHMQSIDMKPNRVIFLGALAACGSQYALREGRWIHDMTIRDGVVSDPAVGNTIVDMYAKCGSMMEAHTVFISLPNPNIVSWGALITGYVQQEQYEAVLKRFQEMQSKGIRPNRVIFLGILQACSNMGSVEQAEAVHDQIVEEDLESDHVVKSALISLWATRGNLEKARALFDASTNRNIVTWSVMLSGYVQHEQYIQALRLFEVMQQSGVRPDKFVFTCVLKACAGEQALLEAMLLHNQITKDCLEKEVSVGSSLVDAYAKCRVLKEARAVFDNVPEKNEVSWGAMLAGYNQHGEEMSTIELFQKKLKDGGMKPNKVELLCILKACGSIGTVWQGKMVHNFVRRSGLCLDIVLGNAMIDMYAKCGELEEALAVFSGLQERDIVSWGALISGCAQHGLFEMVALLLRAMQCEGVKPNDKIFSSVLSACSHAGLAKEGYQQYEAMVIDHRIAPSPEHLNCMVDLFSRVGCFNEVEKLLESMPVPPDSLAWTSLLTACRTYGNLKFGRHCYENFVQLSPSVSSGYVTMCNIYADVSLGEI
ncbi:hypothetical protein GOP47_0009915 [Adiantum capillus-veneris]|uniref:Pentatricopeptide repeat-containing protein n=1 Tax=Adiantum capillus-veneris TaxID=13818 RepID=A0A9D4UXR0_ADICA|nr:hypothetical protein GOP47_0009915 [Adiantum capillus-veneris]